MAASDDKAVMTLSAALLPLEMRKTLSSLSMEYTPANNSEAWYTKITTIGTGNQDLFAANMFATSPTAGGSGTYGSTRAGSDTTNVINTITIANDFSDGDKATLAGSPWRGILNHDDASTGSVVLVHSSTFNSTVDDVNNNTYAIHGDLA